MNFNTIIFADLETGGLDPRTTQPTQLAAVAIHPRKLEIIEDSIFQSYIKPIFDPEKQKEYGLGEIGQKALEITKISIDTLEKAPPLKVVWKQFEDYVNQFNPKKTLWGAPIMAGFNNHRYDDIIFERIMGGNRRFNPTYEVKDGDTIKLVDTKEPYKFGPWDDKKQQGKLLHPMHNLDTLRILFNWFENDNTVKSLSMDNMRTKFGIDKTGAHNAVSDVVSGALLLIKFMKLTRHVHNQMRTKFENSFELENKTIARIVNKYA